MISRKENAYFNFQNYRTLKLNKDFFFKLLLISNNSIKTSDKKIFSQSSVKKKIFLKTLNFSIFKNFKSVANGNSYFIKFNKQKNILEKKVFVTFHNVLIIKLNKKLYSPKVFLKSNFLTYQENLLLLFKLGIVKLKQIFKKDEESRI